MKRRILTLVMIAAALVTVGAAAHHSYGATYRIEEEVRVEGKLVQFLFRNPHSFVQVEVPDDGGEIQRWSVEWSGTGALQRQGVDRATLRVGDQVVVTGNPSRAPGEYRLRMVTLFRPVDGLSWGTRPGEVVD